ncbi:MAG: asparagine synthase (glutamine-hydrolyzing) [Bacteroidetes bacterium]|nr:MAG: asparagine synthase (glutamine-hydrolyzing) [Bacteroidota bacterium]
MCGINIIITTQESVKKSLLAMQETTKSRGPDSSGLLVHTSVNWQIAIGVNRLQVVDRNEKSNQPMVSPCGNYVLAYNGEVYNYQDLKNQLIIIGYTFTTNSDTEVVLTWIMEHGAKGIADFKGMFALAFINLREREVAIARDRHGIKPLYVYQSTEKIVISSSARAIETSGLVKLELNNNAINDYLSYRHVIGNATFYQEIKRQEPGAVTTFNSSLSAVNVDIKSPPAEKERGLKSILVDTLAMLYDAPTPAGLMLSGGVDSTLLLAVLNKELGVQGLNTYTLDIGVDRKWAKQAAVQYGSNHHEIPVSPEVLHYIDDFLNKTDQPIADHGAFATWLVAREATKNSNILLSGAGADELFGGYNRHRAYYYYLKHQQQALFVAKFVRGAGINGLFPLGLKQLLTGIDENPRITYQNFLQNHGIKKNDNSGELWDKPKSLMENLQKALDFDRSNYLVGDVLAITDNSTMQHGVEARVPFLYDDVVSHAGTISIEEKMKHSGKGQLKEILKGFNGQNYTQRAKQGFGLPMGNWLRDKNSNWLWEFLLKDSPLFEIVPKSEVYQLLRLHQASKHDYSMQLWSILVLEKWLSRFYR